MEGVKKQPSFPLCPMQKPDHTHCGQSTPVLPFAPHTYQHLRQEKRPPALRNKGLEVSPVTLPPLQLPLTGLRSGFFNSALALSTKTQSTQALFITTATHPQPWGACAQDTQATGHQVQGDSASGPPHRHLRCVNFTSAPGGLWAEGSRTQAGISHSGIWWWEVMGPFTHPELSFLRGQGLPGSIWDLSYYRVTLRHMDNSVTFY